MSTYDLVDELNKLTKVETDVFGPGKLLRVFSSTNDEKGPQFASELSFLVVEMKSDDGSIRNVPIVVKKQMPLEVQETVDTYAQFANEVNMYSKIMPCLGVSTLNVVPRIFFGRATCGARPEEDILILEDLRELGFKIPKPIFLDFEHISKALRKLGQFHGLSYNFKKSDPTEFADFRRLLKIPQSKTGMLENVLFKESLNRAFNSLLEKCPNDTVVNRTYERLKQRGILVEWERMKLPVEPFAVVSHGDFNRNNLFYQYDSDGTVTDVKFYDFGTALVSDPSIDIAFFLYLNTNQEARIKHWDEFLEIYWSGLTSVAPEPGFTFEEFLNHFQKRAISGFCRCSLFLPFMLHSEEINFFDKTDEERSELAHTIGGEEGTEAIVNILIHARDNGFMLAYLEDEE